MGGDVNLREDLEALRTDLHTLKNDLRTLVGDSAQVGRHAASQAREKAKEVYQTAKAKGREATEALEEKIEENPFMSVGIAFGVGLAIGALISRR